MGSQKKTVPQVIAMMKRGSGAGKVFTPSQVGPFLDKELQVVADAVKEFIFATLDATGRQAIRRDQSGLYQKTTVTMTTNGGKISLPIYAQAVDEGRRPQTKLVPLAALIQWIKRYRIVGRTQRTGQFKKAAKPTSVNDAAVAIQRAIFKNGIQARPFLDATLDYQDLLIAAIVDEIMIPQIISIVELTLSDSK